MVTPFAAPAHGIRIVQVGPFEVDTARVTGPTHSIGRDPTPASAWASRPGFAAVLRVGAAGLPVVMGVGVALAVNSVLPPAGHVATAILRCLAVVGASTATVWAVDRGARRVLPLATLMRLSLVFPDQAPSRFKMALRSGSSRRLARNVEAFRRNGLDDDPARAAEQVVELIGTIGSHDRRTRGHSERVRLYAALIGEELHLSSDDRQRLEWAALIHDLGKLTVPPEILNKAGRPTAEEWAILANHPAAGEAMIEPLRPLLGEWVDAVGGHHEKWDGSGYPRGLVGDQISRPAAIVAVADAFEVMTAIRSYKRAMPITDARAELTRCAGTHFSPDIVRAFLSISIRRLRLTGGPLAALAHLPFVQGIAGSSLGAAAVGQTVSRVAAALPSIAAGVVTGSLVISAAGPVSAQIERPPTAIEVAAQSAGSARRIPTTTANGTGGPTASTTSTSAGAVPEPGASDPDPGAATTTSRVTTTTSGSASDPSFPVSTAPVTTASPATTTPAVTSAPSVPPSTAPPSTSAAPPTTIAPAPVSPMLMVSNSPNRTSPRALQGAPLVAGSSVYVFIWTSSTYSSVDFWKGLLAVGSPDLNDTNFPFDLAGTNGDGTARPTTVPLLGLSVTAKFHGQGPSAPITATSSIL